MSFGGGNCLTIFLRRLRGLFGPPPPPRRRRLRRRRLGLLRLLGLRLGRLRPRFGGQGLLGIFGLGLLGLGRLIPPLGLKLIMERTVESV